MSELFDTPEKQPEKPQSTKTVRGQEPPAAPAKKQLHIVRLESENVKRLTAVSITPEGLMIQIAGKNGAGKSSVLDSIAYALGGEKLCPSVPIRTGQEQAVIKLDLGDIHVTRTFTAAGSRITVTNREGLKYPAPQKKLDDLLSSLTFDPLEFINLDQPKQFAFLRGLVKIDIDLDQLAKDDRSDTEERTLVNRQAKNLRAQAEGIQVPAEIPERVDVNALMITMSSASTANGKIAEEKRRRERLVQEIEENDSLIVTAGSTYTADLERLQRERDSAIIRIDDQIKLLEQQKVDVTLNCETAIKAAETRRTGYCDGLRNRNKVIDDERVAWPELETPVDVSAVMTQIEAGNAANAMVDVSERRAKLIADAVAEEGKSTTLTENMETRKKQRAEAIASAKMPIDGLTIGDGIVLFDDLPLDQASTAQQLRISCALAMAANPELRIIRIRDGDKLDDDNMAVLAEMAEAHNFQCWLEVVKGGPVGEMITIEDGHVAEPAAAE